MSTAADALNGFLASQKVAERDPGLDDIDAVEAALAKQEAAAKARTSTPEAMAAARAPARMPPNARPGDAGLLPEPPGVARQFASDVVDNLRAIPAGFNDAVSSGLIPRASGALGGPGPAEYQQTMAAGPTGAAIGQLGGTAASMFAGPGRALVGGGQRLAGLLVGRAPGLAAAARSVAPVAAYGAGDAAARGGSAQDIAEGAGTGALMSMAPEALGAAKQGVNKLLSGSVSRAEVRGAEKLIDQATWGQVAKAAGRLETGAEKDLEGAGKEAIIQTARDQNLGRDLATQSVPKFANAVEAKKHEAGQEIGRYIRSASGLTPGVRLDAVLASLDELRQASGPATDRFKAITQEMNNLQRTYQQTNVVANMPRVPVEELWQRAQELGENGYAGVGLAYTDPRPAKQLGRDLSRALRGPMYDEVNRVAMRNPATVGSPEKFAAERARFSDLAALSDLAEAARPKTTTGKEGLFARMDALKHIGHGLEGGVLGTASHLLGGGPLVTAGLAAAPYAPGAARAADNALAKLVNAARAGFPARMYQQAAQELGVDPATASRIWTQFGAPMAMQSARPAPGTAPMPGPAIGSIR